MNVKKVLLTGASSKLGMAISLHLARRGYDLILHCNSSRSLLESIESKLSSVGSNVRILQADFENIEDGFNANFIDAISDIDVLINNASLFTKDNLRSFDVTGCMSNIMINAIAPVIITQKAASKSRLTNVINILDASPNSSSFFSYSASKILLEYFTKICAKELAPSIRVNGISLGYVQSGDGSKENELAAKNTILKEATEHNEVLGVLDLILSSKSMTGSIIKIDGGLSLKI